MCRFMGRPQKSVVKAKLWNPLSRCRLVVVKPESLSTRKSFKPWMRPSEHVPIDDLIAAIEAQDYEAMIANMAIRKVDDSKYPVVQMKIKC